MRVLHVVPVLASRFGGPAIHVVECALATLTLGVEPSVVSTNLAGPPSRRPSFVAGAGELPSGTEQIDLFLCEASWPYRFAYSRELKTTLSREVRR